MKNYFLFIVLIVVGCTAQKDLRTNNPSVSTDSVSDDITIRISNLKIDDENIEFNVFNNLNKDVFIHQPKEIKIEKFQDGKWILLKILRCPCGAPCARPPENIKVLSGGHYDVFWDKKQGWCVQDDNNIVPKTIYENVDIGKYRIKILYGLSPLEFKVLFKEFEINNVNIK